MLKCPPLEFKQTCLGFFFKGNTVVFIVLLIINCVTFGYSNKVGSL